MTELAVSKTWQQSNLQPILSQYGLPAGQRDKKKHKKKQSSSVKTRRARSAFSDPSDDRDEERDKYKQQRNMEAYKDMYKLRDYYYEEYMSLLRRKIDKQKSAIQKRSDAMESRIRMREEMEKQESHKLKKKMERHDVEHSDDFLKHIPKSKYYKIVALQDKMKATGKLKTTGDIDHFWQEIRKPDVYNEYFPPSVTTSVHEGTGGSSQNLSGIEPHFMKSRTSSSGTIESMSGISNLKLSAELTNVSGLSGVDYRPLSKIQEMKESSRPSTQGNLASLAITTPEPQLAPPVQKRTLDPITSAKQAAVALDKKYPQMELPPLACFEMELGEKPPDPQQILKELESKRREKERKVFVKKLRRMYQLSMTNNASTKRIMDKHTDEFELAQLGSQVQDRAPQYEDEELIKRLEGLEESNRTEEQKPWLRHIQKHPMLPIEEERSSEFSLSERSVTDPPSKSATTNKSSLSTDQRLMSRESEDRPIPLSICNIESANSTLEAKCLSSMWNNYLHVGKSAFAK